MRKFFVFDAMKSGDTPWDPLSGIFDDRDEAETVARAEWRHLTETEQRKRLVFVAYADIPDGADPLSFVLAEGCYECLKLSYPAGNWRQETDPPAAFLKHLGGKNAHDISTVHRWN